MILTPEQKQAVASWVEAGDNLSTIQRKLAETFQVSLTYRDVRFLVDDLDLNLKDASPRADLSDVSGATPAGAATPPAEPKGFLDKAKEKLGFGEAEPESDAGGEDLPPAGGNVTVAVDKVTLLPGALASGTVTFSDGVTGKWVVDQFGRPGFTEISKPGYRPNPADAQEFMQELSMQLQRKGF